MRKPIAVICVALAVAAAAAGTALSREPVAQNTANDYYTRCMENDDERMSDSAQESLCGCASAQMMMLLSREDIDQMTIAPGPGRAAFDKMLTEVYAPCMQVPTEEILFGECMGDNTIKNFALRDQGALCMCVAKTTAGRLPVEAPKLMRYALEKDPKLSDAYNAIVYSADMRMHANNNLFSCLQEGN